MWLGSGLRHGKADNLGRFYVLAQQGLKEGQKELIGDRDCIKGPN